MPVYRVTDPNTGQTLRLTGDSPPTEQELEQVFAAQQPTQPEPSFLDRAKAGIADFKQTPAGQVISDLSTVAQAGLGNPFAIAQVAETAAPIAAGVVAEPVAGLAGIGRTFGGLATGETLDEARFAGAEQIGETREALSVTPQGEFAKRQLETAGEVLQPVGEAVTAVNQSVGDFVFDVTGSPDLAAAATALPTAIVEVLGLKGLSSLKKGTRLLDDAGRPTKVLRKQLDKQGLDFDDLSPEVKAKIPKTAEQPITAMQNPAAKQSEKVVAEMIESGAKNDAFAGLKVEGGRVVADAAGNKALRQGWKPGVVSSVKQFNTSTRSAAEKMLNMRNQILKTESKVFDFRPSDVAGKELMRRVNYLRHKATSARHKLDALAKTELRGKSIDSGRINNVFQSKMDELGVTFEPNKKGVIKANFKNSQVLKNKSAQKAIQDAYDLINGPGPMDALKAHQVKRQFDELIDYRTTSKNPITKTGKDILKSVRAELNNAVRKVDSNYAKFNDDMSTALTSLDMLDDATGVIKIFGEGSDQALGTNLRALLSNRQGRIALKNAIDSVESSTKTLGGKFNTNINDLVLFADALDEQFGAVARTSFGGEISKSVERVLSQGPGGAATDVAAKKAGVLANKALGKNDFNAVERMRTLLRQAK